MKKFMHCLLMAVCLSVATPIHMKADIAPAATEYALSADAAEKASMARLKAIRELAKTKLSKEEKKALRQEVLAIRKKHTRPGGVIFISTGGLILIIILLIILL